MKKRRNDYYYKRAKSEGFRSRASYKLMQIQERYHIIREGDVVVDLGAAPGGWLQVILALNATAIAVDRQQIAPLEGVVFIKADITAAETVEKIRRVAESVDVVVSDAAPNLSGVWSLDHARSIDLARSALKVAERTLRPGGNFLVKVFQGDLFNAFVHEMSSFFSFTRAFNPQASRKQSAEIYLIGKRFSRQQRNALASNVKQ
ncbi:MAG: RlmE family RNA methyltransferase [Euryarchaeota archaeon]|nr:RlmE family RNA methyltransferase [Euryarchaeota archaeon]